MTLGDLLFTINPYDKVCIQYGDGTVGYTDVCSDVRTEMKKHDLLNAEVDCIRAFDSTVILLLK